MKLQFSAGSRMIEVGGKAKASSQNGGKSCWSTENPLLPYKQYCPQSQYKYNILFQVYCCTVQPWLADTPEIQTFTVMWTLCAVPNISYILYQTTPEIRTPL